MFTESGLSGCMAPRPQRSGPSQASGSQGPSQARAQSTTPRPHSQGDQQGQCPPAGQERTLHPLAALALLWEDPQERTEKAPGGVIREALTLQTSEN